VQMAGDGGVAGQWAVDVGGDGLSAGQPNAVRPQVGRGARCHVPRQAGPLARQQGEELVGDHTEDVAERARVTAQVHMGVLVDHAAVEADGQRAPALGEPGEVRRGWLRDQVERGCQEEFVTVEFGVVGAYEVNAAVAQSSISNGAAVVQWNDLNIDDQFWKIVRIN
jgi:hypothetical protein